jgi:hypothetical protein
MRSGETGEAEEMTANRQVGEKIPTLNVAKCATFGMGHPEISGFIKSK